MIHCFINNTKGDLLFYYFEDTTIPFIIRHRGLSIKKGIIRKRLTIKVLEKIYYGYSPDFYLRFKMNRLEINDYFLDNFEKIGLKLLYKI